VARSAGSFSSANLRIAWEIADEVSWSVLPLVAGLFVLVEAMSLAGAGRELRTALQQLAVLPAWLNRGGSRPGSGLLILLAIVAVAGLASAYVATRAALGGRMLEALRTE